MKACFLGKSNPMGLISGRTLLWSAFLSFFTNVFGVPAWAMNSGRDSLKANPPEKIFTGSYRESLLRSLYQPLSVRIVQLQSAGERAFSELERIAFDSREQLHHRWRAITAMGQVNPERAVKPLEMALTSPEWFLRNAAMIAMTYGSRERALRWAKQLLDDKALVVRTAAVQAIDKLDGSELVQVLWEKLDAQENFKSGQSLWVRRHIVRVLSRFAEPHDTKRFLRVLRDSDQRLYPWAIKGLEKLEGLKFGQSNKSTSRQRELWLKWGSGLNV